MSKPLLISGIAIAASLLMVLLFNIILDNPEIYRQQLGDAFQKQTGFELEVQGDINWRFFPPVAIEIGQVSITPQGFDKPLARFESASFDLKLIPLILDGKLAIDRIRIDGLEINAIVNEQGQPNWETDLATGADKNLTETETGNEATSASEDVKQKLDLDITAFEITDMRVSYQDLSSGRHEEIVISSLVTGALRTDQFTTLEVSLQYTDKSADIVISNDIRGSLAFNGALDQFSFDELVLNTRINYQQRPEVNLRLQISGIIDTSDDNANQIVINSIKGNINNSNLEGNFKLVSGAKTHVEFLLMMDSLNTADYLETDSNSNDADTAKITDSAKQKEANSDPIEDIEVFPVQVLSELILDGRFRLGEVNHEGHQLKDLAIELHNDGRKLNFSLSTKTYGGELEIKLGLGDISPGRNPTGKTTMSIKALDLSKLAGIESLTGTLVSASDLTFKGNMLGELLASLDGKTSFTVTDGTLDISPLKKVSGLIDSLRGKPSSLSQWPDMLPFDRMAGDHHFNQGVTENQQFELSLENMTITGNGGMDYFNHSINYDIETVLTNEAGSRYTVSPQLANVRWPLHCEGSMEAAFKDLCLPNSKAVSRLVADVAKQQLKKSSTDKLLEKIPDKYKDQVKKLFKGLFD